MRISVSDFMTSNIIQYGKITILLYYLRYAKLATLKQTIKASIPKQVVMYRYNSICR